MKKRIISIAAALMMFAAPAMAQVFISDDDENNNRLVVEGQLGVENPWEYNLGVDVYTPVGEGIFVLAGLAGAYLLGKRKKED